MSDDLLEQEVIVFDAEKCSGCSYCMVVCAFHHHSDIDLDKSYIHVFMSEAKPVFFVNAHCTHCEHPICEAVCPTEPKAIIKDPKTGIVTIDTIRCIGCKSCNYACPLSIPLFDQITGVSNKCDFCDGDPFCVKYCSTGALKLVSRREAKKLTEASSHE